MFKQPLKEDSLLASNREENRPFKNEYYRFSVLCLQKLEIEIKPKMRKTNILVYYPENSKVLEHRPVKFIDEITERQTQTYQPNDDDDDLSQKDQTKNPKSEEPSNKQPSIGKKTNTEEDSHTQRYPKWEQDFPCYLVNYVTIGEDEKDQTLINIDYCYKALSNGPRIYREAKNFLNAHHWIEAIQEVLESLKKQIFQSDDPTRKQKCDGW